MSQQHVYSVKTSHGDVELKTPHHHDTFDTIEDFLAHHKESIKTALGVGSLTIQVVNVYLNHGKGSTKVK